MRSGHNPKQSDLSAGEWSDSYLWSICFVVVRKAIASSSLVILLPPLFRRWDSRCGSLAHTCTGLYVALKTGSVDGWRDDSAVNTPLL